jgi:thiamine-monophosphate kinase
VTVGSLAVVHHHEVAPAPDRSDAGAPVTVADLGEDLLLARVFPLLPAGDSTLLGPGDDAAVLRAPDQRVVISTDLLVEGHHFRRDWSTGRDVGYRAAVQNLADVAAMGAVPTAIVVGLVLPPALPVAWVLDLASGLGEACEPVGAGVVGGDLSAGEQVVVAITVLGDLEGRPPVLRSGAGRGDVVAHCGVRGRSAAGLAVLHARADGRAAAGAAEPSGRSGPDGGLDGLVQAYLRPEPPLAAGVLAARAGATAMLDVSDGLLRDAGRLARASGVVLDLDAPGVVFADDLEALAPAAARLGVDAQTWVLTGGEDHGLLATFPAGAGLPEGFRRIGTVHAAGAHPSGTVLVSGQAPAVDSPGWDHFRR